MGVIKDINQDRYGTLYKMLKLPKIGMTSET
jgi:hypothetical protein